MWYMITMITVIVFTVLGGMFCAAALYSAIYIKRDYKFATMSVVGGVACIFFLFCELKLLTMI